MIPHFNLIRICTYTLLFFLFASFIPKSSDDRIQFLNDKLSFANANYPNESVYLHTDRQSYWASEDLWFKAYLQSKSDSSNVYVELISPIGKIIQKKMFLAIDGLAYGDFHLPDTTSSGVYQIRAYTNWMRNFEPDAFFYKNLIIWNIKKKHIDNNTEKLNVNDIDLRFFPEGGTFLTGMRSKLGFKAVYKNGIGVDISGVIVDDKGAFVTIFKSQYKGMGNVEFIPEFNKKYKAEITINDKKMIVDLPTPTQYGVTLSVATLMPEELRIVVAESKNEGEAITEKLYYILGQTRGNMIFSQKIKLLDGFYGLKIEKNKLPTGVLQVTLFDSNMLPLCERLLFINHDDYVHVDVRTGKELYSTREEVIVDLKTVFNDSLPLVSNLSLSAFATENQMKLEEYPNNILTQFLLNADLRGRIEEPAYYFKDKSRETLMALDNLMLTQGWRRFSWQALINNEVIPLPFEQQSSIVLKGKVTNRLGNKPQPNSSVTLFFDQLAFNYVEQKTDALGQFCFDQLYFFDETTAIIKTEKENGKKNIWLEVDDRSDKSPVIKYLPIDFRVNAEERVNTTYDVSIKESSLIQKKWHISDTILLDDIDVFGFEIKKEVDVDPLFMNADMTAQIDENTDIAASILDYMQLNLPGVYIDDTGSNPVFRIGGNSGPALLLLDGFPVESDMITTFSFSDFKRVDVLRFAPMYGIKGNNGAINFTLNRGTKNVEANLPDGINKIKIRGYAVTRQFYSPNYNDTEHSITKTDFRSTLYWNPNFWTDADGKAKVSFYNSDQPGDVNIVIEGFTADGRLCRGTHTYKVKH